MRAKGVIASGLGLALSVSACVGSEQPSAGKDPVNRQKVAAMVNEDGFEVNPEDMSFAAARAEGYYTVNIGHLAVSADCSIQNVTTHIHVEDDGSFEQLPWSNLGPYAAPVREVNDLYGADKLYEFKHLADILEWAEHFDGAREDICGFLDSTDINVERQ